MVLLQFYWADNWFNVDERDTDNVIRLIRLVDRLSKGDTDWDLAGKYVGSEGGENWIMGSSHEEFVKEMKEHGYDWEDSEDMAVEWIRQELSDWGLLEWNSYYQEEAPLEAWRVTYFDEYGVEHKVKVNLPKR